MKRAKRVSLKSADKAGWYAEFPEEIWGLIIGFLRPNDEGVPDLAVLITLLGTCKMLVNVLRKPLLAFINEYIHFEENIEERIVYKGKERLFSLVDSVCRSRRANIVTYLYYCILDKTQQNAQQLSTCLSVLQLAYLEGRYLYRGASTYRPIVYGIEQNVDYPVGRIRHFDENTGKVSSLARMKGVSIGKMFNTENGDSMLSLVAQVISLMHRTQNNEGLKTFQAAVVCTENTAGYMDLLVDHGTQFATRNATVKDSSLHLIVNINGRQHSFYSKAAAQLRGQCFIPGMRATLEEHANAYILDSRHKRNWATVEAILLVKPI